MQVHMLETRVQQESREVNEGEREGGREGGRRRKKEFVTGEGFREEVNDA